MGVTRLTNQQLRIRAARADDAETIFDWRNDPTTRRVSVSSDVLSLKEHLQWYNARLTDSACRMYIGVDEADTRVGVVRFDRFDPRTARVSIHMAPDHRGRGLGSALLKLSMHEYLEAERSVKTLEAVIKSDNTPSERMFSSLGFSARRPADVPNFFVLTYSTTSLAPSLPRSEE